MSGGLGRLDEVSGELGNPGRDGVGIGILSGWNVVELGCGPGWNLSSGRPTPTR